METSSRRGERRTPVSQRSPEQQSAYTEQRRQREQETEQGPQDVWEFRRQELAARGDIFDARGNVTRAGGKILLDSQWTTEQILAIEALQRNHAGEVQIIPRTQEDARDRISAHERPVILAAARNRAQEALAVRAQQEKSDMMRRAQDGRRVTGMRAFNKARTEGKSDEEAARLQREAEAQYDLDKQQERNRRAAS